jgi:hypothetical protein
MLIASRTHSARRHAWTARDVVVETSQYRARIATAPSGVHRPKLASSAESALAPLEEKRQRPQSRANPSATLLVAVTCGDALISAV